MIMELATYLARVWNDINDYSKIKDLYIYAHQPHFYPSMFNIMTKIHSDTKVYLLDSPPGMSGYRGFNETKQILLNETNIEEKMIIPIPFKFVDEGMVNTFNESKNLVLYLNKHSIKNIMISSPIFHLPRAFITLVSVLGRDINVFCHRCGYIQDWNLGKYTHSQGVLKNTTSKLLESEIDKISLYHKKGDLISISEVLDYLDNRKTN